VAGYAVLLVFCLWMWANWVRFDAPLRKKVLVRGLAVAIAVAGGYFMLRPSRGLETNFAPYRPGAIAAARQQGRPTLVKFTASWCTACLVVDRTVYDDPAVAEALRDRNVAVFKADVTKRESQAAEFLYGTFGTSPPLTVLYPPGENAEPIRLVGEFSSQELLEALEALPAGGEQGPVASEASGPDGRS
jgi:thiol:disulfide interchange protein